MPAHRLTREEFILKSSITHNNRFNYDLVEYISYNIPVKITDPVFGVFEQKPVTHMRGCIPKELKLLEKRHRQSVDFVTQASLVHNNLYSYDNVEFLSLDTNVEIIDPEHGSFYTTPRFHLNGRGHIKRRTLSKSSLNKRREIFINESLDAFGEIHDFSKFIFKGKRVLSDFIDKKYGHYTALPLNHLRYNDIHPMRKIELFSKSEFEIDHIVPLSILVSGPERSTSYHRNRPLVQFLNSDINLKKISTSTNRRKNDKIMINGIMYQGRIIRGDWNMIKQVILNHLPVEENVLDVILEKEKNYSLITSSASFE